MAHPHPLETGVDDPLIGRVLDDRFRIVAPLGSGGMGSVYLAVQTGLDRRVALKVLPMGLADRRDLSFVKRFCLEAAVTARLAHPNVVTVHDYGRTDDGVFYIAMEFLEGRTLGQVLEEEGRLAPERALELARQIAWAVREAHRSGLVHRDLKPSNVMLLEREGEPELVKVLDFGLARFYDGGIADPSHSGAFLGSPSYMAPELARGEKATPRSDVYSLGVMLYEIVCGQPPFSADSQVGMLLEHASARPRPPRLIDPGIPVALERAILQAMQKDPAARFPDMDAFLDALAGAAAPVEQQAPILAAAEVAALEVGARRRAWKRRLAPLALVAAAAGGAWALVHLLGA